jgi:3-phenylpropionate/trans-cinnamate dioxygenase ferredoxin reductase subunit
MTDPVVVVGGGLAGAKVVETLRSEGYDSAVVLLAAESELPYERPLLSKDYLAGTDVFDSAVVHDAAWYDEHDVDLRRGTTATGLDPARHQVELGDGSVLTYHRLVLATGASPIRPDIPGVDAARVLRTRADADALRAQLGPGARVAIIGAGWIGMETAAAAIGHGAAVTVLESGPAPLARALGARIGAAWGDAHRRHGVDVRTGAEVAEIAEHRVVLADGSSVEADVVLLAVGARPVTGFVESAGLAVDNGVLTDAALRTSHPDVLAVGDVANAWHPRYRRHVRVEHWANALNQGPAAARSVLGQDVEYRRIPYFYTDQFELGMEYAGHSDPEAEVVIRGDLDGADYHAFWVRPADGDTVVVEAAMHVNRWEPGIEPLKSLVEAETPVERRRLVDEDVALDELG